MNSRELNIFNEEKNEYSKIKFSIYFILYHLLISTLITCIFANNIINVLPPCTTIYFKELSCLVDYCWIDDNIKL